MAGGAPRGAWGSKAGFVLAAAGSAVGLGNVWGFPTTAAKNGGGAFLFVYLLCVVLIGIPVLLAELAIGRRAQRNPVGAFRVIRPGSAWPLVGGLGVVTGLAILSFYSVVAGWTLAYVVKTVSGTFRAGTDTGAIFAALSESPVASVGWHLVFMALTIAVVLGGVKDGIERWSKVLMPALFVLLVGLALRAVTLSGAREGLVFYLHPDVSKISAAVVLAALGQAFFSLSLGMGAMITYGSYLSGKDSLATSAFWVAGCDTAVAFLAGLIIFPTLFHAGLQPGEGGPGMVFVVLTSLLGTIPPEPWGGILFGTGFFLLLAIAALTSSVSLLEVGVAWLADERGMPRRTAALAFGGAAFLLGIPSALDGDVLGWLFKVFGQYSLVIGAFLIAVFAAWIWGIRAASEEIADASGRFPLGAPLRFLLKWVCPLAILAILVSLLRG